MDNQTPSSETMVQESATVETQATPAPVFTPQIMTTPAPVVDELDELDAALESLGAPRSEYVLEVHRLINYERDQRADPAAKKKYCSLVDVSSQVQEEIRIKHGGGYYILFLKQKGKIKKTYFVSIDGEPARPAQAPAAQAPAAQAPAQPSPLAALEQLVPLLGLMKQFQQLFTPSAPTAQPSEITPEAAMMKLISVDQTALATFRERLLGPSQPQGRSLVDLFEPIVHGIGPQIAQLILNNALNRQPINTPAPPVQPQAQPRASHASGSIPHGTHTNNVVPFPNAATASPESSGAPTPEMLADDQEELVDMPHLDCIDGLVTMMVSDLPVSGAARLVQDFCAGFPDYAGQVQGILSYPPDQVLGMLCFLDVKHTAAASLEYAPRWIADLQQALAQQAPNNNSEGEEQSL